MLVLLNIHEAYPDAAMYLLAAKCMRRGVKLNTGPQAEMWKVLARRITKFADDLEHLPMTRLTDKEKRRA